MEDNMNPFIGTIDLFPFSYSPRGWAECNGQTLSIQEHEALYTLIGKTFGQDSETTFNLPKIEPPVKGMRYCIALEGIYPPRG